MKTGKFILGVFIVVSVLNIIGIAMDHQWLRITTKPIIMLSLMAYYSVIVEPENKIYLSAIFLSFMGDVFLMFDSELNFMLGLGSFLGAHILFIIIVVKLLKKSSIGLKMIAIIPFSITFLALIFLVKENLGDLLIPVIVYGLMISVFGVVALLHYLTSKTRASFVLLIGALFFILSDSTLAINKFYQEELYFSIVVMLTYIIAQFLICKFMISEGVKGNRKVLSRK